jgi:hypothetical protein
VANKGDGETVPSIIRVTATNNSERASHVLASTQVSAARSLIFSFFSCFPQFIFGILQEEWHGTHLHLFCLSVAAKAPYLHTSIAAYRQHRMGPLLFLTPLDGLGAGRREGR